MSINSQMYAGLADDSYDVTRKPGVWPNGSDDPVLIEGVEFNVLEQYDNPKTGYQGTIYQRIDTGEIVVGHRGTEFDRELLQDGAYADAGMVWKRSNQQLPEAMALTERAIARADEIGKESGHTPQVTVTGHSLGGCLAQITAYRLGLYGEAFNPYGAVSLDQGVPEGGKQFLNHVIATDPVSAASPHYGQVKVYAREADIMALWTGGYGRYNLLPDQPVAVTVAGLAALNSHNMHNFLNVDGDDSTDVSVLLDPRAQTLAQDNMSAIDEYRGQIQTARVGLTAAMVVPRTVNRLAERLFDDEPVASPAEPAQPAANAKGLPMGSWVERNLIDQDLSRQAEPGQQGLPETLRSPVVPLRSEQKADASSPTNEGRGHYQPGSPIPSFRGDSQRYVDQLLNAVRQGDQERVTQMWKVSAADPFAQQMRQQTIAAVDRDEQLARQLAEQTELQQQEQQRQQVVQARGRSL